MKNLRSDEGVVTPRTSPSPTPPLPFNFRSIRAVMGSNTVVMNAKATFISLFVFVQEYKSERTPFRINVVFLYFFRGMDYTNYNFKWATHTRNISAIHMSTSYKS